MANAKKIFNALIPILLFASQTTMATPGSSVGELREAATLHSIGLEWDITGDDNHDATATVKYRVQGTSQFQEGMPLLRIDDSTHNMLAGSLLFLNPGTTYEVELDYNDPDGGHAQQSLTVTTRPTPQLPTAGRTLHVVPGNGGGDGSETHPFNGFAAAQSEARPGDIFLVHGGAYELDESLTFYRGGTPEQYVVWKAAGDGEVDLVFESAKQGLFVKTSHLWLEGFRIQDQNIAVRTDNGAQDVVIQRCAFPNVHYGVWLQKDSRDWYIADNEIVGDNDPNVSSLKGEGIDLGRSDGHVVAHNRISRTADGISYPRENCDIYGNDIFDTSDDGIEADEGRSNLRIWGNRIHNARHNGITFQSQEGAPWYIIGNQIINNMQSLFKLNAPRRYVVLHNTFITYHDFFNSPCWRDERIFHAVMRNNLWYSMDGVDSCSEPLLWEGGTSSTALGWWTDLDYDAFGRGDQTRTDVAAQLTTLFAETGRYEHAVAIDDSCFASLDIPGPAPTPVPEQWVELTENCPAVDAGELIPGVNDQFEGAAPDMGAFEFGGKRPHFGPRPLKDCDGHDCLNEDCPGDDTCIEVDDCVDCFEDVDTGRTPAEDTGGHLGEEGCSCTVGPTGFVRSLGSGLMVLLVFITLRRRRASATFGD